VPNPVGVLCTFFYANRADGTSVATHREKQSLPPLQTFIIDVISADDPNVDHEDEQMMKAAKLSSTYIRDWIVKNQGGLEDVRDAL
jgi:hypothetical protein